MARVGVGLGLDDGVAGVFVWLCGVRVCHGTSERDGEMLVMRRERESSMVCQSYIQNAESNHYA